MKLQRQNAEFRGIPVHTPELRYSPRGNAVVTFLLLREGTVDAIRVEMIGPEAEEFIENYPFDENQIKVLVKGSEKHRKYESRDGQEIEYDYISAKEIMI